MEAAEFRRGCVKKWFAQRWPWSCVEKGFVYNRRVLTIDVCVELDIWWCKGRDGGCIEVGAKESPTQFKL